MHTRFEIFIHHKDRVYAGQAADEAFHTLDALEQELSRFIGNSDISRINHSPAGKPVQVGLETFDCLKKALQLSELTNGAFDITAKAGESGPVSWKTIELDESGYQVLKVNDRTAIDLGGIGKGFALDHMAEVLKEWEVSPALIHGGASTALALDTPPGQTGWKITVSMPDGPPEDHETIGSSRRILKTLRLKDRALSGSGIEKGSHIIDPRSGRPAVGKPAAWALAPDAAAADALSTAFMVMAPEQIERFCQAHKFGAVFIDRDGNLHEA